MVKEELDSVKAYFGVLSSRMKERDEDCANPKCMIDKGYSLAINHMNAEIDSILSDLEKQVV